MRVLYVVESTAGGVLSVIQDSIRELQASFPNMIEFSIVYSTRSDTPADIEESLRDVEFIRLSMGSEAVKLQDILTVLKLRVLFRKFDVVHMHSSRAGFLGRLALVTLWDKPKSFYSPHCFGFLNLSFSKFKRYLILVVERVLSTTSKSVFVACGPSELMESQKISSSSILITNGYTKQITKKRKVINLKNFEFIVVGSGRNSLQKDPSFFLDIASQNNNTSIKFTWIGEIDSVLATGWLSRESAIDCLENGSVFLATSLWEGLPVNGIEALALGLPLVVRDTSSYIDLVEHGKNGYIYSTIEEANNFLSFLQKDQEKLLQMSNYAIEFAEKEFSNRNYRKLYDIYVGEF